MHPGLISSLLRARDYLRRPSSGPASGERLGVLDPDRRDPAAVALGGQQIQDR
jgi:hypothetical protein